MPRRSASTVDYYIIAKEYHRVRQHPSPAVTSNHQPLASYSSHSLSHLEASIYSHRQFPSLGRPPLAGSDPPGKDSLPSSMLPPPWTGKKSPKVRKGEPHKVVKRNPATTDTQVAAENHTQIKVHIPTQKELHAAGRLSTTPQTQKQAMTG
ncbi:hypothetical protein PG988_000346 [Apiospora saccharicola]